jgi:nitroreductase
VQKPESESVRKPHYPINPLILNRWSPRSMTGEGLNDDDIMSLFEAARWAPSTYNNNHGDLFMPKETQNIGTGSLIC